MLRILGDRRSLMAALTAHWLDQQLQLPPPVAPARPQRRGRPPQ
jgi:hypothetical protein